MLQNIGLPEILLIGTVLFIFFGPKHLIKVGKELGQALRELRGVDQEYKEIIQEVKNPPLPEKQTKRPKKKGGVKK